MTRLNTVNWRFTQSIMIGVLLAAVCVVLTGCLSSQKSPPTQPFSLVVLPDTQIYSLHHPEIFTKQTQWIKDEKDRLNIACVIHEGDITDRNTEAEWENADHSMSLLDGVVPYCMVPGNHDYDALKPAKRNSELFNKYFGSHRFENKPWYGGHFGDGNENAFYTIHAGGINFLIVCLEFGPRDEVLEWANKLVAKHKRLRTIVVTHCYTYSDDTRVGKGDSWNPHGYGCENDGDNLWDKFIKNHENIFLVLSGHILNDGVGRLTSIGDQGNKVHQILANYQMKKNGGNGRLRIMRFLPAENKIVVTTYSPHLELYIKDGQNQFEVEYEMNHPTIQGAH